MIIKNNLIITCCTQEENFLVQEYIFENTNILWKKPKEVDDVRYIIEEETFGREIKPFFNYPMFLAIIDDELAWGTALDLERLESCKYTYMKGKAFLRIAKLKKINNEQRY